MLEFIDPDMKQLAVSYVTCVTTTCSHPI